MIVESPSVCVLLVLLVLPGLSKNRKKYGRKAKKYVVVLDGEGRW